MRNWIFGSLISGTVLPAILLAAPAPTNVSCPTCGAGAGTFGIPNALYSMSQILRETSPQHNVAGLVRPRIVQPTQGGDFAGTAAAAPGAEVKLPGSELLDGLNPKFESAYWNYQPTPLTQAFPRWDGNPFYAPQSPTLHNGQWIGVSQLWEPLISPGNLPFSFFPR
jgi:hypothetical protein